MKFDAEKKLKRSELLKPQPATVMINKEIIHGIGYNL